MAKKVKKFAEVSWTPDDVLAVRDEHGMDEWTLEQAEEWLENNQRHIQNRLVELGNAVIFDLFEDNDDDDDDDDYNEGF